MVVADGAVQGRALEVECRADRQQILVAADQVGAAALEYVASGIAEADRGDQRPVQAAALLVESAGGGDGVGQTVEQIGAALP